MLCAGGGLLLRRAKAPFPTAVRESCRVLTADSAGTSYDRVCTSMCGHREGSDRGQFSKQPVVAIGGISLPTEGAETRVRSRGLPRNRGMARTCGIIIGITRRLLVVKGAGDDCLPKLHHQPWVCASPCPLLWAAFVRVASECTTKQAPVTSLLCRKLPACAIRIGWVGAVRIVTSACVLWDYKIIWYEPHAIRGASRRQANFQPYPS